MKNIEIKVLEKPKLNSPYLIQGLPGVGNVAKIAADHLIKELKAKKFAELFSQDFPPQVLIGDDHILRLMKNEFYYWKAKKKGQKDCIILTGDTQGTSVQSFYGIAEQTLEFAESLGVSRILALGGVGLGRVPKAPRVVGAATSKELIAEYKKHGVVFEKPVGVIFGAAGLLPSLAKLKNIDGICLLGETHGQYVDARAAKAVLHIISKQLGVEIGVEELDKRAKETEEMISRFEEIQKSQMAPQQQIMPKGETESYIR